MSFWEKIKKDVQRGVGESIAFVKEGATVVQKKAEELTEEGKRRYRLYELQTKVQKEIAELGGRVYDVSPKLKNPMLDSKVKTIKARIGKLQNEIMKLEGETITRVRKTVSKKRTVRKSKETRTTSKTE